MIYKIKNIFILFVLLFHATNVSYAQSSKKDIQAVFLYNLVNYIFWPNDMTNSFHNICLVNDPSMEDSFVQIQRKAKERGKVINVFKVTGSVDAFLKEKVCHILFFTDESEQTGQFNLKPIHDQHILTVSATKNFSQNGIVEFVFMDGRSKLILNVKNLKDSGLSASSKLLRLSKVISQ